MFILANFFLIFFFGVKVYDFAKKEVFTIFETKISNLFQKRPEGLFCMIENSTTNFRAIYPDKNS